MLFNWTDFWIVLGVLGTILVILDLCMVGADNSMPVVDQAVPFSALCYMVSAFLVSEIDKNPCLWATRGSAFHRWHFVVRFSDSWSVFNNVFNTLRPRQNGRRFADDTFKRIFLNENVRISIKISMKFVPRGPINNNSELVQIMAWRRSGNKPLSEPMMVSLLTHICVTLPQWVKLSFLPVINVTFKTF